MTTHTYLVAMFSLVLLAGFGGIAAGIKFKKRAAAATGWPVTKGKILSSSVKTISDTGSLQDGDSVMSVTYRPEVSYEYTVGGAKYKSSQIAVLVAQSGNEKAAKDIVDRYPVGKEIDVMYNPAKPKDAILEQCSPKSGGFFTFIGIFFIILGACGLAFISMLR